MVPLPSGVIPVAISLGFDFSCIVTDDGRVFWWGDGEASKTGHSSNLNLPLQMSSSSSYVSISLGKHHACAITTLAELECWGENNHGQLGDGTNYQRSSPTSVLLPSGTSVVSVSSGYEHTCAITDSESVYCWGNDNHNRLNTVYNCDSDSTNGCDGSDRVIPALAQLPQSRGGIAIFAAFEHTCIFIDNGGIYCFGENQNGRLGAGTDDGNGPLYVSLPVGISPKTNDRDLDHDNVFNNEDDCMDGETGWTSNSTTDYDGDGCRDATEDLDDDNDFLNDTDEATIGSNSTNPDTDGDGYLDLSLIHI